MPVIYIYKDAAVTLSVSTDLNPLKNATSFPYIDRPVLEDDWIKEKRFSG